jgi:hypothetical protein
MTYDDDGLDREAGESRAGERAVIVLIGIMAAVALVLSAVNLLGPEPLLGERSAVGFADGGGVSSAELNRLERRLTDLEARTDDALARLSEASAGAGEPGAAADLARAFADLRAELNGRVSRMENRLDAAGAPSPASAPTWTETAADGGDGSLTARIEALEWRVETFNNLVAPDFAGEIGRQRECIADLQTGTPCAAGN